MIFAFTLLTIMTGASLYVAMTCYFLLKDLIRVSVNKELMVAVGPSGAITLVLLKKK